MRQTDRQTDRQTSIALRIHKRKLLIGIFCAFLSFALCCHVRASVVARIALPAAILIVAAIELQCPATIREALTVLWSIAATFVTVFTSQLLLNESTFSLGLQRIALNMAICGIVMGIHYLITAKLRASVIVGMAALLTFTAANYFVFKFRGSELCPADLLSLGTAAAVADRYTYTVDPPFIYAVIIAVIYCFAGFCTDVETEARNLRKSALSIFGVVTLIMCIVLGRGNIVTHHFLVNGSVSNGYLLNFTLQIEESLTQKPLGYNANVVHTIESVYGHTDNSPTEEPSVYPDIIVIMNESFADLNVLGNTVQTNVAVTPFLNALTENVIRGNTLSSVLGGGTPNSEYEFLTGNTLGFLPAGSIPYQQFVEKDTYSIASYLESKGYSSLATHPQPAKNWLRYLRYPDLGFDEMYFIEDYPQKNLIREYVSDQEMYQQMIAWYENKSDDEPMFFFGITMQNHGFYDYAGADFFEDIQLSGYAGYYPDVEQYLTLIHKSDLALEYFINYFENVDRDVIILFYGDHFPKLDARFYEEVHGGTFDTMDEQMLQYTVPFLIWANFDIEEQYIELTSLNFLSNLLLEAAGLELPAYNCFLTDVQQVIPAMNSFGYYSMEQGKFIPYDKATGIEAEMLQQYRILQYNCIFDEENRSDVFFPSYTDD